MGCKSESPRDSSAFMFSSGYVADRRSCPQPIHTRVASVEDQSTARTSQDIEDSPFTVDRADTRVAEQRLCLTHR